MLPGIRRVRAVERAPYTASKIDLSPGAKRIGEAAAPEGYAIQ
jgi:hypothetical protein